jgi:hypothetical protein
MELLILDKPYSRKGTESQFRPPFGVGVAALFTFKRRWIVNFATSHLKKPVFVYYHVMIISATIVPLNALPSMVLILFSVRMDNLV